VQIFIFYVEKENHKVDPTNDPVFCDHVLVNVLKCELFVTYLYNHNTVLYGQLWLFL
jgi:hypothetical protein